MRRLGAAILCVVFLTALPLAGLILAGRPLEPYLEFPPRTRFIAHAPFSWTVFGALAVLEAAVLAPLGWGLWRARGAGGPRTVFPGRFPWWGWAAAAALLVAWVLAWSRFPWFARLQPHTFPMLWGPFILVANALCQRRTGRCPLTDAPGRFLRLFPVSAAFWWFFEVLNRFVQNWHYSGADYPPATYFLLASLSFATVLPAVASVQAWLASYPAIAGTWRGWRLPLGFGRAGVRWTALALAAAGLAGVGVWPDFLFPLLWLAPLVIVITLAAARSAPSPLAGVFAGDWSAPVSAALAGLLCGFWWELWNLHSLARWEYSIPYVQRFHLFEMPLLGYAGYLPFGLECLVVSRLVMGAGEAVGAQRPPPPEGGRP